MKKETEYLRPVFQSLFKYNWIFGLSLILLFGITRFILVLHTNITKNYGLVSIIFILMIISPFLFLNKNGRSFIGIKKPDRFLGLIYSLVAGSAACTVLYFGFHFLFGHTTDNAFIYISNSYAVAGNGLPADMRLSYFMVYSLTGMTVSPFGEELFYRGLVHGSFVSRFGEQKSSRIDSLAFAITHLAHFGVVYIAHEWKFLFIPSLLWVAGMYLASRIFFICKQKTGSILGAILAHAAFNVTMMYFIFIIYYSKFFHIFVL